jgi:hypothetical protein
LGNHDVINNVITRQILGKYVILPGLEATKTIMTWLAIHLDIPHPRHGEAQTPKSTFTALMG